MIIAVVLIVIAVVLAAVGAVAMFNARRGKEDASPAPLVSQSLADASQYAATLVAEARTSALHSHEAAMEEVKERLAAVEGREAVIAERHKHLRERREIFDDRRFAYRKRRDEIEERRVHVAEQAALIEETLRAKAALDRDGAATLVLERVQSELVAERAALVEATVAEIIGDRVETSANDLIVQAVERQDASNVDSAPRMSPLSLEGLDDHARERLVSALTVIAEQTGAELGVDPEKQQATLRTVDPIGREIARQAALEVVDRRMQATEVPPVIQKARRTTQRRVLEIGERALWLMQIEGRPELAELVGTLHHRFSYGQNALLHCEETGHLCGVLAAEMGLPQSLARQAGMLHDIGKAVDHDVEGVHAIIGGELLRVPRRRSRHRPRGQGAPLRRGAVDRPRDADDLCRCDLRVTPGRAPRHPGHVPAPPRAAADDRDPPRRRRSCIPAAGGARVARVRQGVAGEGHRHAAAE